MNFQEFSKNLDFNTPIDIGCEDSTLQRMAYNVIKSEDFFTRTYNAYVAAKRSFNWTLAFDILEYADLNSGRYIDECSMKTSCDNLFREIMLSFEQISRYNEHDLYTRYAMVGVFKVEVNIYDMNVTINFIPMLESGTINE